jgi:DNA polymerase-3 subunit gamma/tau
MLEQDLAGAMLLFDDINKKGFEGDMVLNVFAEVLRNVLICKDERVAGLLEVVESFKKRYAQMAQKMEPGYLISALNILNESEINYRSARNKRLHVELALIKLCYLGQALQLTSGEVGFDKNKLTDKARSVAFKNIAPIAIKPVTAQKIDSAPKEVTSASKTKITTGPKLIIEETHEAAEPVFQEAEEPYHKPPVVPTTSKKLSSLEALQKKFGANDASAARVDTPLTQEPLHAAWNIFIEQLKEAKNPAWQSFQLAELIIKDANCFEATASNKLQHKFLEFERKKACAFLQKELHNRKLQFSVLLIEGQQENILRDLPLSSKEQYQKIIEQFPLVKELKDRLRLELDY